MYSKRNLNPEPFIRLTLFSIINFHNSLCFRLQSLSRGLPTESSIEASDVPGMLKKRMFGYVLNAFLNSCISLKLKSLRMSGNMSENLIFFGVRKR